MDKRGAVEKVYNVHDAFYASPPIVSTLPDRHLIELSMHRDEARMVYLWAEVLARVWLYENRCPAPLVVLAEKFWSTNTERADWKQWFESALIPLRRRDHGGEYPMAECFDARIWGVLVSRIAAFLDADGLIPLVPPSGGAHDGIAVPFRFVSGCDHSFCDAKGRPLFVREWERVLEQLGELGPQIAQQSVWVDAVFPAEAPLTGVSLGLPLAIAWARREARDFPLFSALDLLATGEVAGEKVFAVRGTGGMNRADQGGGAKGYLAERLGVRGYIAVDVPAGFVGRPNLQVKSFPSGTFWTDVRAQTARVAVTFTDAHRHLQRIEREDTNTEIGSRLRDEELWARWRRLERLRTSVEENSERASMARIGQRRVDSALGFDGLQDTASESRKVVAEYHGRVFVGRKKEGGQLDEFLQGPGGMMLVLGPPGHGKSALLAQLVKRVPKNRRPFVHFFRVDREKTRGVGMFRRRMWHFLLSELGYGRGVRDIAPETLADQVSTEWQNWATTKNQRDLVLVIDGLDEAEDTFDPPWRHGGIPSNVHIIASCRTGPYYDMPPEWESKLVSDSLSVLKLTGFAKEDIIDLLTGTFATDKEVEPIDATEIPKVGAEIYQRSKGSALFAKYLVDDIVRASKNKEDWQAVLARTPVEFTKYLRKQWNDFSGPQTLRAHYLMQLLLAAYGPLHTEEIRLILPDIPNGYAFNDFPWQAYRWIGRRESDSGWGEEFYLTDESLRKGLRSVVQVVRAEEWLFRFCQDGKYQSPYAKEHGPKHVMNHLRTQTFAAPVIEHLSPPVAATPAVLELPPRVEPEQVDEPKFTVQKAAEECVETPVDNPETPVTKSVEPGPTAAVEPAAVVARTAEPPVADLMPALPAAVKPVATWDELLKISDDPGDVRRELERALRQRPVNFRWVTDLVLSHAKLVHKLASSKEHSVEPGQTSLDIANRFLNLRVHWDPAAQVMWRLVAAREHHHAGRKAECHRLLCVVNSTRDVRLPSAWAYLAGAIMVEIVRPDDPLLRQFAKQFLGIEPMSEMLAKLAAKSRAAAKAASGWLERGHPDDTRLRPAVVRGLVEQRLWPEAQNEVLGAEELPQRARLFTRLAEAAQDDLHCTDYVRDWAEMLWEETQVPGYNPEGADALHLNSALGRIIAVRARHRLLANHDDASKLVAKARSCVSRERFSRGSGKFDVEVALSFAFAAAGDKRKPGGSKNQLLREARKHRREAFSAWIKHRNKSGDTLEVFQFWLWLAHLTLCLVRVEVLPAKIGAIWERRLRRLLLEEGGDDRIRELLNVAWRCRTSADSLPNERYLEPMEWDSAMVTAVEAVLEGRGFTHDDVLQVISRSRTVQSRAKAMARWIDHVIKAGTLATAEDVLEKAQLRGEDWASAHSLIARRLLEVEDYENVAKHIVASILRGTEPVEGTEATERVELLATISRAAQQYGAQYLHEAASLVTNFPNSKTVEKALLCSTLAQTAAVQRQHAPLKLSRFEMQKGERFDKAGWAREINHWFNWISRLEDGKGTGYQKRARKVAVLCEKAKSLSRLDWDPATSDQALKDAEIFGRCEPSLQRRCELMCDVAEAYAVCGNAEEATNVLADIQAEIPNAGSSGQARYYFWRKPGIKPSMLRPQCLSQLILGLGRAAVSWRLHHGSLPQLQPRTVVSAWRNDTSLTSHEKKVMEQVTEALQNKDLAAVRQCASELASDQIRTSQLRAQILRSWASHVSWTEWALFYMNDPDQKLLANERTFRGWTLACAATGQWSRALQLVDRISDPDISASTQADLAELSAAFGSLDDVRKRARELMSNRDKDRVLHRILTALASRHVRAL
ncbi:MAG: P-loop domain-containing protein, partial [Limisphaerales bacterium]